MSLAQYKGGAGDAVRDEPECVELVDGERMIQMKRKADSVAQRSDPGEHITRLTAVLKLLRGHTNAERYPQYE